MITKSDARKILEETCGEYIAIDDAIVTKVTDGFNEIIATRSPTLRAPVQSDAKEACKANSLHVWLHNPMQFDYCPYCGRLLSQPSDGG